MNDVRWFDNQETTIWCWILVLYVAVILIIWALIEIGKAVL